MQLHAFTGTEVIQCFLFGTHTHTRLFFCLYEDHASTLLSVLYTNPQP